LKKFLKKTFIILLISLSGLFGEVHSQKEPCRDSLFYLEDVYNERFVLQTDRTIYAIGERILFRAFNISHPEIQNENWSKVLYIELIKPDGRPVKQAKFPLTQSGAYGYIEIPDNLLTGNYYIVLYTKWMRNFSPDDQTVKLIRIINPFKSQLEESCYSSEIFTDSVKENDGTHSSIRPKNVMKKNTIICQVDKKIYHQREKVTVKINVPEKLISSLTECSMSVVRPGVTDTTGYSDILPDAVIFDQPPYLN